MQYCKDIVFQGTTWDSVNNCTDKMQNMMSGITVKDSTVKAEVVPAVTEPDSGSTVEKVKKQPLRQHGMQRQS